MGKANKLAPKQVENLREPGYHSDGAGLYLNVTSNGTGKSWVLRYMMQGKAREMGLGSFPAVSLAEARLEAGKFRLDVKNGIDPLDQRKATETKQKTEAAKAITFEEAAQKYIQTHKAGWKNAKHVQQWENSLRDYAGPVIGKLPVQAVELAHIIKIFETDNLWATKTETASRLRGRIEKILDWASVRGYRTGENPAVWRGRLDKLLPAKKKVQKRSHFAALPFEQVADFMADLKGHHGSSARALEFCILTAARSGEVRLATWEEFDLAKGVWVIPAERMKMGKEHRVPMSDAAIELLNAQKQIKTGPFVFPGRPDTKGKERPLSDMTLTTLIRRMDDAKLKAEALPIEEQGNTEAKPTGWRNAKGETVTAHGFRSSFRDWASETTAFSREVCESALAHAIEDRTEAAYRRGDLFTKRTKLMQAWSDYCNTQKTTASNVTGIGEIRRAAK